MGGNLHFTQNTPKNPTNLSKSHQLQGWLLLLQSSAQLILVQPAPPLLPELRWASGLVKGWWCQIWSFFETRCEYVKGGVKVYDLTYSTEFDVYDIYVICWYGIGAVLVFCSSLALLKIKGLLVWRFKEDVVLLLMIRTCVVQVWRGNFQVHKARWS